MKFEVEKSKDNYNIVKVIKDNKTQYLGSKYCEKREIDNFINSLDEIKENYNYIIFGLGAGEHLKELKHMLTEHNNVLIIEISKGLVEYCKAKEDIEEIFNDERFNIATELHEIEKFFLNHINELNIHDLKVGIYGAYQKVFLKEFETYYSQIKELTAKIIINRNTKLHYSDIWLKLFFSNIYYISRSTPINYLKNKLKETPAIIVSAGPSLSKNIDKLKNVHNAVIFSGGRTLNALMDIDVEPDVLCVVDSSEDSYRLVEEHIAKVKCPLVFYEGTNNKIVKEHKAEKVFSTNSKFIKSIFNKDIISLSGGGSVAHSMTMLASYMGCNPIIFIGQDLSYTNEQGHADCAENRWEEVDFTKYKKDDDIYVNDIYGNKVRTSIELNDFRISLENIISKYANINFINATEGGVNIKGTKIMTLVDALELVGDKKVKLDFDLENRMNINKEIIYEFEKNLSIIDKEMKKYDKKNINLEFVYKLISELTIPTEIFFGLYYECKKLNCDKEDKNKYLYEKLTNILIQIKQDIKLNINRF